MCFTLINVPYGALGSSLTRDTEEITIFTSVRMIMANLAGLIIKTLPLVIALFAPKALNEATGRMEAVYNTPEAEQGILWLVTLIPAVLFVLAIYVIGKYELSDRKMDEINAAITSKNR